MGILGRLLCIRDNRNFTEKQPEFFVAEEIDTVFQDDGLLYVCYQDASCVNVYRESGEFLWAVSTPYLRNTYFEISDQSLIVYNGTDAYLYDKQTGDFIKQSASETMNLSFEWQKESCETDTFSAGDFCFDSYCVYQIQSDGGRAVIVSRPWWYLIFNFSLCWIVGFAGAAGIGMISLFEQIKKPKAVKTEIKDAKAKKIKKYLQVTTVVQGTYTVFNVVLSFLGAWLCIGIIPIALHFMVSMMVISNQISNCHFSRNNGLHIDRWLAFDIASFIAAFLSVVMVAAVAA